MNEASTFADIDGLLSVMLVRLQKIEQVARHYDGISGGQEVIDALASQPLTLFMKETLETALQAYAELN